MALFTSYRYRYGRRARGRYARSRSKRRATGNARAARQQRDAATVTISRIFTYPIVISTRNQSAAISINHWNSLRLSEFYGNYSPMYDQVKIDKIRIKVTGNQAGSAMTSILSPSVVLAFDRNGIDSDPTTAIISTYSSAQLKQWSTGNAFVMYQTIYPSTIMEKGMYIPTESLLNPSDDATSLNPCVRDTTPTIPFKPITLLGVDLGVAATSDQTFAFTLEFEYTVTFRGMRKPSISSYDAILVPLSYNITANGTYNIIPSQVQEDADGFDSVSLAVNVPTSTPTSTALTGNITTNGTYTALPSQYNVDYFSGVQFTVNVPSTPSTSVVLTHVYAYIHVPDQSGVNYYNLVSGFPVAISSLSSTTTTSFSFEAQTFYITIDGRSDITIQGEGVRPLYSVKFAKYASNVSLSVLANTRYFKYYLSDTTATYLFGLGTVSDCIIYSSFCTNNQLNQLELRYIEGSDMPDFIVS